MDSTLPVLAIWPALSSLGSTHCLSTPIFTTWIIVLLVALVTSSISSELKATFIVFILVLYWRNIDLLINLFQGLYYPSSVRKFTIESAKCALARHFTIRHNFYKPVQPTIFICNYARDRFENAFVLFLPTSFSILVSDAFASVTGVEELIPTIKVPFGGSFAEISSTVTSQLKQGKSIVCYAQKPLYVDGKNYGRFRSGLFHIARTNPEITLTPLYIQPFKTCFGAVVRQPIHILMGKPAKVVSVPSTMTRIKAFFNKMDTIFNEK